MVHRKLNPALSEMSQIVHHLRHDKGLVGPKLMKEAGKIYRKSHHLRKSRAHRVPGSRRKSSSRYRSNSRRRV
jgi:hypothetical protein